MTMNKEFVTKEIALAFKKLGFNEECLAIYYKDDESERLVFSIAEKYSSNPEVAKYQARDAIRAINFDKGWAIAAPLWQQAIDFLREKHNIHIIITCIRCHIIPTDIIGFQYRLEGDIFYDKDDTYATYPEAREQAILKAIELCKNKKY